MIARSPKDLALLINNQRKKLGLSQATAADLVGLKQKTISAFENHPEGTKLDTLFRLLSAANLDILISPKEKTPRKTTKSEQEW